MKSDRLATEQQLAAKVRELGVAKTTFPISVKNIVSLKQSVDQLTNGIKEIDTLAKELGLRDEDIDYTSDFTF